MSMIQVLVTELGAKTKCIDIQSNATISQLKHAITDKSGYPETMQILTYNSKLLSNPHASICSFGIHSSSVIRMQINYAAKQPKNESIANSNQSSNESKSFIQVTSNTHIWRIKLIIKRKTIKDRISTDVSCRIWLSGHKVKRQRVNDFELISKYFSMNDSSFYKLYYSVERDHSCCSSIAFNIILSSVNEANAIEDIQQKSVKKIINDSGCDKYLPSSHKVTLLIFGFIHSVYLNDEEWDIVPIDVLHLCFKYFHQSLNMFLFHTNSKTSCFNVNDGKHLLLNIYDMDNPNTLWMDTKLHSNDSVLVVDDIYLPKHIEKSVKKLVNFDTSLSVMFEMRGSEFYGVAFNYFDNIFSDKSEINGYKFRLPYLEEDSGTKCHSMYSHHFGLMLLFEDQSLYNFGMNWKWNTLWAQYGDLSQCAQPLIIDNNDLFVLDKNGKGQMFDIWGKDWQTPTKRSTYLHPCGISCYDRNKQRVYIGGGEDESSKCIVEYFDFYSDRWIMLPKTKYPHQQNSALWQTEQILFNVRAHQPKLSEYLDLRVCDQWRVVDSQTFNFQQSFCYKANVDRFVPLYNML